MFKNKQEMSETEVINSTNTIGKGTVVRGDVDTFGNIRIEGKMIGDLKTKSKAVLGDSSNLEGNIIAQNAEILGHVAGKVEVAELLVLKGTAVIDGDIVTNKLVVESGASFNGSCKMGATIKEIRIGEGKNEPILKAQ